MNDDSRRRRAQDAERGAVLVTGASTGIGRACALALVDNGFFVFAGVRRHEDALSLRDQARKNLKTVLLDLTLDEQIQRVAATIENELPRAGFCGVVNNAGICVSGPLEYLPRAAFREQFEINVISQLAVIQHLMPLLRGHRGRIVNIGSVSGRIAGAFFGPYCASKFALDAVTTALRTELYPSGIHVSLIEPAVIATPFLDKMMAAEDELLRTLPEEGRKLYGTHLSARRQRMLLKRDAASPPSAVCRAVIHALTSRRPRPRYTVGLSAKITTRVAQFLPERLWNAIVRRRFRPNLVG